jgi:hypothetical protein
MQKKACSLKREKKFQKLVSGENKSWRFVFAKTKRQYR